MSTAPLSDSGAMEKILGENTRQPLKKPKDNKLVIEQFTK